MKNWLWAVMVASAMASAVADAHAHLHASLPANSSTVSAAPKQLSLEFNEAVQLTAVTIQKGDGPVTKLGPLPDAAARTFALKVPALYSGSYIVKWRAVSDDGHIMADKLSFKIATGK